MPASEPLILVDGSISFDGGVNSVAVTTIASATNPNGLQRNELAWLENGTMRDGGITTRAGWHKIATIPTTGINPVLFQGKHPYKPVGAFPYEIWSVSGHIIRVDADGTTTDLSVIFGLYNSATAPHAYFVQGKQFMVIQSGDNATLPLIWDGTTLRRSNGLTGNLTPVPDTVLYNFTVRAVRTVPAVGLTVVMPIEAIYPGAVLDEGIYQNNGYSVPIGTFIVTAFSGAAPFTVTLQTVSSNYVGAQFSSSGQLVDFTVSNPALPPVLVNEIPAATAMRYYALRIWYTIGSVVSAGDVLFGPSGTQPYNFADSILKVTENPLAISGDGFEMPGDDGNITGLQYGANIDASLGQGRLFAFTRKAVYGIQVPVNRIDWIGADANNQPLITVVQLVNGSVNDRSIVPVNGDLYYQSLEPGIRSLNQSVRQFSMAGNRLLSANEQRLFQFQDRSLMDDVSGIYFHNRLWETVLPRQTDFGIVHDAMVPLDFMPISTLQQERQSNWEGVAYGIPIFQVAVLDFGGRERAFATVLQEDNTLGLWEVTTAERFDFSSDITLANRVPMRIEFPAWNWDRPFDLKKMVTAEILADRVFGEVVFTLEFRPDGATCWLPWHKWKICSPRNSAETCVSPISYPLQEFGECYLSTMTMPKPPENCAGCNTGRPANIAYQFQCRLTVFGFCRIRGFLLHAEPHLRKLWAKITC